MPTPAPILATRTTTRLLDDLREGGSELAWTQIDARYRPVIAGLARRLGLGESDAEEAAQQALAEFARAYRAGRYNRSKGRLSSWILGIARNTALHARRAGGREIAVGRTALAEIPDESALRGMWNDERDRVILRRAFDALRDESAMDERTLLAFELVALRGSPASVAAERSGMSVEQVYVSKTRVTKRLRQIVTEMTAAFEEDE